ncbi:MAG: hypothetical protein LBB20_03420 [Puniceicoccales bacterium]|jgi:hypothetical protein|nr:hypothetical protein [Puniceicoccales bacterium]
MVYIEADSWSGPFTRNAILPISKISIPIFPQPVFTSVDIKSVEIVDVDYGKCLMVTLSERASYDLYKISIDSLDNRLILTVNGKVVGFSVIDHAINDGTILVFAEMRLQDLEPLVLELNETIARINKMKKER